MPSLSTELISKDQGWKPNRKQEPFLQLPITIKEAFYGGGAGSGKSDVLLYYPLVWNWHHNPRFKQVFMRRTFPELRNEIVPRSQEIYRRFGATFNKSDMCWTFPRPDQFGGSGLSNDGSRIFLGHCETEDDVHKYDSMEINLFTPDELTSFTEWIYTYIGLQRTRTSDPTLPAIIRAAGMPGGIGHTWVNHRFVKPYPAGGRILVGRGGIKRIFIHATQDDNPYIDPNYKNSLMALPDAERNAKLYGDFEAYLGQVFEEFRDQPFDDEPDNARHVIEPFVIPDFWPRLVVGDWGMQAMTYILWAAISPDRRVYVYREQYWRKSKIEEWAPFVKVFLDKENVKTIIFCQSTAQDRGAEHTIHAQIEAALGVGVDLSGNSAGSRISTKALLHEYLRWKAKVLPVRERAEWDQDLADRMYRQGPQQFKDYLKLFEPDKPEGNLPKLQIFNTVPLLIETIKACVYAKANKSGVPAEDVAEFDGDDPYDTLRYLIDRADRYFNESKSEFEKVLRREELVANLAKNSDYHEFHMRARALEAGRIEGMKRGLRRFH